MAATVDLSNVTNALSQMFENDLAYQMNRVQVLLSLLPKRKGSGKNCAWDTEMSAAAAAAYADGADVAGGEYGTDDTVPATLGWGLYRSPGKVSGLAQAVAESSDSPTELRDLMKQKIFGNASKLGSVLNAALYTGVGTTGLVAGLTGGGALASTGTYATIDRAVFTEWAGNLLANGAVPRDVTFALIDAALEAVFNKAGGSIDVMVCPPAIYTKIGQLFGSNRRWTQPMIQTAAGEIKLSAGWQALDYAGIPILRDKDCPSGRIIGLSTPNLRVEFLPTRKGQDNNGPDDMFMLSDERMKSSMLPARIEFLGKTGDTIKWVVKSYLQLAVKRPNAFFRLEDLQ